MKRRHVSIYSITILQLFISITFYSITLQKCAKFNFTGNWYAGEIAFLKILVETYSDFGRQIQVIEYSKIEIFARIPIFHKDEKTFPFIDLKSETTEKEKHLDMIHKIKSFSL